MHAEAATPVDEIRTAATQIRERAEAAVPGPWSMRDGWDWEGVAHYRRIANAEHDTVIETNGNDELTSTIATAEHIATWHPAVALAVADWLDTGANPYACVDREPMLAVARAYNGTP